MTASFSFNCGNRVVRPKLEAVDSALIVGVEASFTAVGDQIERAKFKTAINEAMATADQVNQYFSQQEPWKALKENPERARTIIYVAVRCVDSLKTVMTPFLPFTSQRLHRMLGYSGTLAGSPEIVERGEEGDRHVVLTDDYSGWEGVWEPSALKPGTRLDAPEPLFRKLHGSIVEEEVVRMAAQQ